MSKFTIQGGKKLSGTIQVAGNKNAVLPIMAATLLIHDEVRLENVPRIQDVVSMSEILIDLGASVRGVGTTTLTIDTTQVRKSTVPAELANKLRASVVLLGPMYARFGVVKLGHPGGDIIGRRDIDTHLKALEKSGAHVKTDANYYHVEKVSEPQENIFLSMPSVTGTENMIMALVQGSHTITIENAATEPHVVDLIHFLNSSGARITGAGTNRLTISGVSSLRGTSHKICPDYLEAGTFAVLSAVMGGALNIGNARPEDIPIPLTILEEMGISHTYEENTLSFDVTSITSPKHRIQAAVHPGFPTDLMSPFIVLGTQAAGETLFHDPLYESRMFFVDKLISMGARITICDPHRVIVHGPNQLVGSYQASPDIRAGMALVIAALIADGESVIDHAEIVERGYEKIAERLRDVGAEITRSE